MTQEKILNIFKKSGALLEGHFILSSGLHSTRYMQCALILQEPEIAKAICEELAAKFDGDKPTLVIGPALGGIIVAYEVAKALGVRAIFAERQEGKMTLRRGFSISPEDKVLVVEDVVTTGGSTKGVIELVKSSGATVVGVGAIVDRSGGSADFGIKFQSVLEMKIEAYPADSCPLCKQGIPATKPGSRGLK